MIKTYISRENYADSIVYVVFKESETINIANDTTTTSYEKDTVKEVIRQNDTFDNALANKAFNDGEGITTYELFKKGDHIIKKRNCSLTNRNETQDLWTYPIVGEGYCSFYTYIKGSGGPYYNYKHGISDEDLHELVYYKKGNITWGSPLIITNIKSDTDLPEIDLFPNPAQESIQINSPEPIGESTMINIYSSEGVMVHSVSQNDISVNSSIIKVDIKHLNPGLYILEIVSKNFSKTLKWNKI